MFSTPDFDLVPTRTTGFGISKEASQPLLSLNPRASMSILYEPSPIFGGGGGSPSSSVSQVSRAPDSISVAEYAVNSRNACHRAISVGSSFLDTLRAMDASEYVTQRRRYLETTFRRSSISINSQLLVHSSASQHDRWLLHYSQQIRNYRLIQSQK